MRSLDESPNSPYIGPSPFETKHQSIFFGREVEADTLYSLLIAERVVLFYAQSGAGKSSLVNAKLIPKLEAEGYLVLPKARVGLVSGSTKDQVDNPFVYSVLSSIAPPEIKAESYVNANLPNYREWIPFADETKRRWLIIDQFEELLTMNQERWEDRKGFMEQVALALEYDRLLSVVFVIRSDYVAGIDLYADTMPNKLRTRFYMELLKRPAALEAVQLPAREFGCTFDDAAASELVEKICLVNTPDGEKAGEYVESVLLQVACRELWRQVENKSVITPDDVKDFEVEDALRTFYENAIRSDEIAALISEQNIRRWFSDKLIVPPGIRGQIKRDEGTSGGIQTDLADKLVNTHLLRTEFSRGALWFELAHDRLVKPVVSSNNAWFSVNENQYEQRARLWEESHCSDDLLLRSFDLVQAEDWAKQQRNGVGDKVEYYFERSRDCENRWQLQAAEQRERELAKEKERVIEEAQQERAVLLKQAEVERLQLQQNAETQKAALLAEAGILEARNKALKWRSTKFSIGLALVVIVSIVYAGLYYLGKRKLDSIQVENEKGLNDERRKTSLETAKMNQRLTLMQKSYPINFTPGHSDEFFEQAEAADKKITEIEEQHHEAFSLGLPFKPNEQNPLDYIFHHGSLISNIVRIDKHNDFQSDTVFYVSDEPTDKYDWQLRYVAYLMMRAGLPVRAIMRTVTTEQLKGAQSRSYPDELIGLKFEGWDQSIIVGASRKLVFKKINGKDISLTLDQIAKKEWKAVVDMPVETPTRPRRAKK